MNLQEAKAQLKRLYLKEKKLVQESSKRQLSQIEIDELRHVQDEISNLEKQLPHLEEETWREIYGDEYARCWRENANIEKEKTNMNHVDWLKYQPIVNNNKAKMDSIKLKHQRN